jgi:hypothetical protein
MDFEQYKILTSDLLSRYRKPIEKDLADLRKQEKDIKRQLDDIKGKIVSCERAYGYATHKAHTEVEEKFKADLFEQLPKIANHPKRQELFSIAWDECNNDREATYNYLLKFCELLLVSQ